MQDIGNLRDYLVNLVLQPCVEDRFLIQIRVPVTVARPWLKLASDY